MKTLFYTSIFVCFLASCTIVNKNVINNKPNQSSLIDYKRLTYKLFIGESKDSIEKVLELRHAYLADDGVIDTNGITHYMNISEDLVNKNKLGLPALFFTIDKQILTEFSCYLDVNTRKFQKDNILKTLSEISQLFTLLNSSASKKTLAKTLKLNLDTEEFKEQFYLDTVRRVFVYQKKRSK